MFLRHTCLPFHQFRIVRGLDQYRRVPAWVKPQTQRLYQVDLHLRSTGSISLLVLRERLELSMYGFSGHCVYRFHHLSIWCARLVPTQLLPEGSRFTVYRSCRFATDAYNNRKSNPRALYASYTFITRSLVGYVVVCICTIATYFIQLKKPEISISGYSFVIMSVILPN